MTQTLNADEPGVLTPADPIEETLYNAHRQSLFHLKAAATAGAGFFTDAYDLNVIGTVSSRHAEFGLRS